MHNGSQETISEYKQLSDLDQLQLMQALYVKEATDQHKIRVIFDTGASRNMSGMTERLQEIFPANDYDIMITGFNGNKCYVELVGLNEDSKTELYCSAMPPGLVLLSGNQYASEGAAILYKNEGVVIEMDDQQVNELKQFVEQYKVVKRLSVKNGIYEVENNTITNNNLRGGGEVESYMTEEAYSGKANRFFNTKVHVSNGQDRVLSMLMMGLTIEDLKALVKHKSLAGMPPDLTERVINSFEHKHGRTPDIITLAIPIDRANRTGLMTISPVPNHVGERVEVDCGEPDYNDTRGEKEKKAKKIEGSGGAKAFAVSVDCYSGYIMTLLLTSTGDALQFVQRFVEEYTVNDHTITTMAADSGIISQSKFQVLDPKVEAFLRSKKIKSERSEPHNHQRGTPTVENCIRKLKELINMAITYILQNPVFEQLAFTERQIYQLWGELLLWATTVINMKPCPHNDTITRYEAFHKKKPNMQNIRLLPIFSIIMIPREGRDATDGLINKLAHRVAVYIGPAIKTPGAIRAAYVSKKKKVQVVITSKYTPASDGWGLAIHKNVQRGLGSMIQQENTTTIENKTIPTDKAESNHEKTDQQQHVGGIRCTSDAKGELCDSMPGREGQDDVSDYSGSDSIPSDPDEIRLVDSTEMSAASSRVNDRSDDVIPSQQQEGRENVGDDKHKKDLFSNISSRQEDADTVAIENENKEDSDSDANPEQLSSEAEETLDTQTKKSEKKKKHRSRNKKRNQKANAQTETLSNETKSGVAIQSQQQNDDAKTTKVKTKKKKQVSFTSASNGDNNNEYGKQYKTNKNHTTARYKTRTAQVETALVADWMTHGPGVFYFCFLESKVLYIPEDGKEKTDGDATPTEEQNHVTEDGFKAVTQNVPKTFTKALHDPRWGAPARKEMNTLLDSGAIVAITKEMAEELLKNQGADLVMLFPVYETKEKDGVMVDKVRLVGDGRTHYSAERTYAATPSREEFLLLMHLIATFSWTYYHVDEIRAFLNAKYSGGTKPVVTKFRGGNEYFKVEGALYGLKSSPRDYQEKVVSRLTELGFRRLTMCSCIFVCRQGNNVIFIYDFVDDFIITGNDDTSIQKKIEEIRQLATTTEPIYNAQKVLGMELNRDLEKKIIKVTMESKILEVCGKFEIEKEKKRHTPMPGSGFIVHEEDLDELSEEDREFLDKEDISKYLTIVGSLVWISGIRLDIVFATMYLTWATKAPRVHHLKMGKLVLSYLYHSKDLPLVLGGPLSEDNKIQLTGYSDASLGTGPKGRSVKAHMFKLGEKAGSIVAKSGTSTSVYTSSFEAELDGITSAYKTTAKLLNMLEELGIQIDQTMLYNDNLAMINFIKGEGTAKGIRHVQLRMFYVREKYLEGNITLDYLEGNNLPVDQLTKIGTSDQFYKFRRDVLGLALLEMEEIIGITNEK
jgi:hypothetical protein